MNDNGYALLRTIHESSVVLARLDDALSFGVLFVWLVGWYILYRMYRLNFLRLIIAGDLLFIALWFFDNRHRFIGHPESLTSMEAETVLFAVGTTLSLAGTIFTTMGACIGVRCLQKVWAEKEKSQPPPPVDPADPPVHPETPGA